MNTTKYICLRFFIVPMEEHLFTKPAPDAKKLEWFRAAFLANRDYTLGSQEYAIRIAEQEDGLVFGKLSRKRSREAHPKTPDDIKDAMVEDWPYLEFACDCSPGRQLIVIEYNSTVIYMISAMKTVLENLVSGAMFQHGYSVRCEPIIDETTFWNLVENSDGVFALSFVLNSPNLFGAESKANEALGDLRRVFNNTRVKVGFENERGLLKVPRKTVESYREYADKGGGEWTITTRAKGKGRKRKHSSTQRALKITAEKRGDENLVSRLKTVCETFLDKLK
jgi:hypothetical protein